MLPTTSRAVVSPIPRICPASTRAICPTSCPGAASRNASEGGASPPSGDRLLRTRSRPLSLWLNRPKRGKPSWRGSPRNPSRVETTTSSLTSRTAPSHKRPDSSLAPRIETLRLPASFRSLASGAMTRIPEPTPRQPIVPQWRMGKISSECAVRHLAFFPNPNGSISVVLL